MPARPTSSSTCCSRAPPTARPRPSPRRSTRWVGTSTPSPPRSTPPSTSGCLAEHLALGLDILSDIMWRPGSAARRPRCRTAGHPGRDPHARRRAVGRGRRAESRPPCSPTTPSAARCWAAESSVPAMTADRIREFFGRHYRPGNMVAGGGRRPRPRGGGRGHARPGSPARSGGSTPERTGARRQGRALAGHPAGDRAGPSGPRHAVGRPHRPAPLCPGRAQPRPGRGAVQPAVPGDP